MAKRSKKRYDAITYGWRNIENGKMYIGYHKTNEEFDGYVFSSEDEEANLAWSYGKLKRSILYHGKQSVAITLENFLLKSVNANKNDQFYNKSVGGGEGCVKDFSNLTDAIKKVGLDWIKGIDPVYKTAKSNVSKAEMRLLCEHVKSGKYRVHKAEKVDVIHKLPRNQVRLNVIEHEHKEAIVERMRDNPANARKNVSPVVVCVHDNGYMEIIDGNHTIDAAHDAGWVEIPVIYINFSEFKFKQDNIDFFGYMMNHEEKIKKPNSKEDLKQAIMRFTHSHNHLTIGTQKFKEAFMDAYGEFWTPKSIAKCIDSVKDHIETLDAMKNRNFKVYSKKELKQISDGYAEKHPGHAVISITSGSCYNAGVGAMANKAGELDTWNAIMIVSHRTLNEYNLWKKKGGSEDKLKAAMKRMHPNLKCKIEVLAAFVDVKKKEAFTLKKAEKFNKWLADEFQSIENDVIKLRMIVNDINSKK